jgi:hypothetical protein
MKNIFTIFKAKNEVQAMPSHPAKKQRGNGTIEALTMAAVMGLAGYLLMDYIKTADFREASSMVKQVNSAVAEWKRNQDDYEALTMKELGDRGLFPKKYEDADTAGNYVNPWDGEFVVKPNESDNDIYEVTLNGVPSTALYRLKDEYSADSKDVTIDVDAGSIVIQYENI